MSYKFVEEKLNNNKLVILDGAMGSELEKKGALMDKNLWCGTCSVEFPELVRKVHEDYIEAGADVITTNTYACTPISMKNYGMESLIKKFNQKSVELGKKAIENSKKKVALAGSVSASGSFFRYGIDALKPGFNEQIKILSEEGVDLIILEAMSSQADIVETMLECSIKIKIPVWLSISCVIDKKTDNLMLGYNDTLDDPPEVYEDLEKSIKRFSKIHSGPILIAHSDIDVTGRAIKVAKKNYTGTIGAYPNIGFYEKPHWRSDSNLSPQDYLNEVKSWVQDGTQIVGGCCGVGVNLIKPLSSLNNE